MGLLKKSRGSRIAQIFGSKFSKRKDVEFGEVRNFLENQESNLRSMANESKDLATRKFAFDDSSIGMTGNSSETPINKADDGDERPNLTGASSTGMTGNSSETPINSLGESNVLDEQRKKALNRAVAATSSMLI